MRLITQNSFSKGMMMDITPSVVPKDSYIDCVNGTILTYNGNEYILLKDSGNVKISESSLGKNYIPMGCKEYGNILYVVAYNPIEKTTKIGSIPSPNYDVNPSENTDISTIFNTLTTEEINTGTFIPKMYKLFTFELASLNPGDLYKLITDISKLNNTNTVFNYKFWVIDESGKRHELKNPNIVDSANGEYKPFYSNVNGVIALEITEKELPYFEISCRQDFTTTPETPYTPKISCTISSLRILDILHLTEVEIVCTNTDTGVVYQPIILNINLEEYVGDYLLKTFEINQLYTLDNNSINLEFGANYSFSIIPITNYKKDLTKLRLASVLVKSEPATNVQLSSIWSHYVESDTLKLDFDIQVPELNQYDVFMEFFDPCQNYSIFFKYDVPNIFGMNTLFILLKDEGGLGTSEQEIIISEDPNIILSKDKRIRKDRLLKYGHLYIVRITIKNIETNTSYIINKLLSTNTILNEEYRKNPLRDFNKLTQYIDKVDIKISKKDETIKPLISSEEVDIPFYTTDNKGKICYYSISTEDSPAQTSTFSSKYSRSKESIIDVEITKPREVFGEFVDKNSLISIQDESSVNKEEDGIVTTFTSSYNNGTIINTLHTLRDLVATSTKFNELVVKETHRYTIYDRILGFNEEGTAYSNIVPNLKPGYSIYGYNDWNSWYKPKDSAGVIVHAGGDSAGYHSPKFIIYKHPAKGWEYYDKGANIFATYIDNWTIRDFKNQIDTINTTPYSGFILTYQQNTISTYTYQTKEGSASATHNLQPFTQVFADHLIFIENTNGSLTLPNYYNFGIVKESMKNIGIVLTENKNYIIQVYDEYYKLSDSTTILNCNTKINASINTALNFYDSETSSMAPLTIENLLKYLPQGEALFSEATNYIKYYSTNNVTSYLNLDLGTIEIKATIRQDIVNSIKNSRLDFTEFESNTLESTLYQEGVLIAFDSKYSKYLEKYQVTINLKTLQTGEIIKYPIFKFNNSTDRMCAWKTAGKNNNEPAPRITFNTLD